MPRGTFQYFRLVVTDSPPQIYPILKSSKLLAITVSHGNEFHRAIMGFGKKCFLLPILDLPVNFPEKN